MKMRKITLMVLPVLFATGAALAQAPQSTITESTDPARIAEVERRAEALRSRPASSATPTTQQRMHGEHGHMHGAKSHHHGGGEHRHGMHGDHPKAAPGAGGAAR